MLPCHSHSQRHLQGNSSEDPLLRSSPRLGKGSWGPACTLWLWGPQSCPCHNPRGFCLQEERVPSRKRVEKGPEKAVSRSLCGDSSPDHSVELSGSLCHHLLPAWNVLASWMCRMGAPGASGSDINQHLLLLQP